MLPVRLLLNNFNASAELNSIDGSMPAISTSTTTEQPFLSGKTRRWTGN